MIHALKILPEFFKAMTAGTKSFEVRKNDRPYHTGDYVALNEWNSEHKRKPPYVARQIGGGSGI